MRRYGCPYTGCVLRVAKCGSAATAASARKLARYSSLSSSHVFCPVAVETFGPLADDAQLFLTEIDRRATLSTLVTALIRGQL